MAVLMAPRSGCLVVLLVQFMVTAASSLKVADKTHTIPFTYVGSGYGDCTACTECQGDCDRDTQCAGGLVCVHNTMFDAIPGCTDGGGPIPGGMFEGTLDFCAKDPSAASATGDPHLQNIYGERFDLMKAGNVTLIHIPRGEPTKNSMLIVEADARRFGESCGELYFQTISIAGAWVDEVRAGGITFTAQGARDKTLQMPSWTRFGPVELKVARGYTNQGIQYLNFYVKHLGHAGHAVGGLLGEDDHAAEAERGPECQSSIALMEKDFGDVVASVASVAEATFA